MTLQHSGDFGDIVYSMPIFKALNGAASIRLVDKPHTAALLSRASVIIPLLKSQAYIRKVEVGDGDHSVDFSKFRKNHRGTQTLSYSQTSYYNEIESPPITFNSSESWIRVDPMKEMAGKVIIARSARYHNPTFPWKEIVGHYGDRLIFVGLPAEHEVFCNQFGSVKYHRTNDFLELARMISGAGIFIGNQSSPQSIAMGIGCQIIQEVCTWQPDCIFNRQNVQYCYSGKCTLPNISGSGTLEIPAPEPDVNLNVSTMYVPPGMWQYPGAPSSPIIGHVVDVVMQLESCSNEVARKSVLIHNVNRVPDFFTPQESNTNYYVFESMKFAGINQTD